MCWTANFSSDQHSRVCVFLDRASDFKSTCHAFLLCPFRSFAPSCFSGMATTQEICKLLKLQPHPEGGFFAECFKDTDVNLPHSLLPATFKVGRSVSTAIYFLMPSGNVSCLHRIPSSEVWHFYKGDPLTVFEIDDEGNMKHTVLGQDIAAGQKVMYVQKPNVWFGAYPTKDIEQFPEAGKPIVKSAPRNPETNFSLVGCTVAPGFEFDDFELAIRSDMLTKFSHAKAFIEFLTYAP